MHYGGMPINIDSERILTFADAARELPKRNGKKVSISTIWRWAMKGCAGVRLESFQYGGTLATSREALQRFFDQVTAARRGAVIPTPNRSQRQRQRSAATAILDAAGCK